LKVEAGFCASVVPVKAASFATKAGYFKQPRHRLIVDAGKFMTDFKNALENRDREID
jgi:hypothetical protein